MTPVAECRKKYVPLDMGHTAWVPVPIRKTPRERGMSTGDIVSMPCLPRASLTPASLRRGALPARGRVWRARHEASASAPLTLGPRQMTRRVFISESLRPTRLSEPPSAFFSLSFSSSSSSSSSQSSSSPGAFSFSVAFAACAPRSQADAQARELRKGSRRRRNARSGDAGAAGQAKSHQ